MKVLLFGATDTHGGAGRAAYWLHRELLRLGVNSGMLVQRKLSDDPSVLSTHNGKVGHLMALARAKADSLPLKWYPNRQKTLFSPAVLPDTVNAWLRKASPEIIHFHWVSEGFIRIESVRRMARCPVVWTLHDMWAFTGGCHYSGACTRYEASCGACPQLGSAHPNDLSHRVWQRKRRAWEHVPLTVVAPSRWMAQCAQQSALFRNVRVEVIPYGLNLDRFKPVDKRVARSILGLPQDKRLVLFGAVWGTGEVRKGFHHLVEAVRSLSGSKLVGQIELVVFGALNAATTPALALPVRQLGLLHDDISLALVYAAADVFIAPSTEDNLPLTVMEATACGTPTVAFRIGGMPDLIEHGETGYLASPFDNGELAAVMASILEDATRRERMAANARRKAEREFPEELQARRYIELYRELGARV